MKRIYIPTDDELYRIQDIVDSDNMYKFLTIKAAEILMTEGVNYTKKGLLNPNVTYKYILDDEILTGIIGRIYPEIIPNCEVLQTSSSLCKYLICTPYNSTVKSLDNLSYFSNMVNYNPQIIKETLFKLREGLINNPGYRFTYKKSPLLESIFSLDKENLSEFIKDYFITLTAIEPSYAAKANENEMSLTGKEFKENVLLGMKEYFERYGLDLSVVRNNKKDILTNPTTEVKRLIKTMNKDSYLKY